MSVPKELEIRINEALVILEVPPDRGSLVAAEIEQIHNVLKTEVVPLAKRYNHYMQPAFSLRHKRDQISKQIDRVIARAGITLSSPEKLKPRQGDLCVLAWSTDLCPKSGSPASIEVGKVTHNLHPDKRGDLVITLDRVPLAEIFDNGSLLVEPGTASISRHKDVYAISPVIRLLG